MKKNYALSIALFVIPFLGFSQSYLDGIFVLNEGNMGSNSASLSFINQNYQVTNNIFGSANNNSPLGDVGQSMNVIDDKAYIVLNGSNAIKVVNYETFETIATINSGLVFPRYIAFNNGKGYVTCWGDGYSTTDDYIAVINLATNTVESTIPIPEGGESIEVINNKLYVSHYGGYGYGNSISVIDIATQNSTSIPVGDLPSSMIVKDNFLYVLCAGMPSWSGNPETPGRLMKINLTDNSIVMNLPFAGTTHPRHLTTDAANLYYTVADDIYKMAFTDVALPTSYFIDTPVVADEYSGIYGLDFIDNKLYVADANEYASTGYTHIYDASGNFLNTYTVGNIPNHFYASKKSVLSVNDNVATAVIALYPNPTSSTFYLKSDKNTNVKIYDFTGKIVKNEVYSVSGVDVSNLAKGIYIVELEVDHQKQTTKLVVK